MRQCMRSMVIWRRKISQTMAMLSAVMQPQGTSGFLVGRKWGRWGLGWSEATCIASTVRFSQGIFSHRFQKIENSNSPFLIGLPLDPITGTRQRLWRSVIKWKVSENRSWRGWKSSRKDFWIFWGLFGQFGTSLGLYGNLLGFLWNLLGPICRTFLNHLSLTLLLDLLDFLDLLKPLWIFLDLIWIILDLFEPYQPQHGTLWVLLRTT